jgi:plastocyanin
MFRGKHLWRLPVALLSLFVFSQSYAQEVQTVTVTVGEITKEQLSLEPKQITIKPGRVQFTLVNKGQSNHNIVVQLPNQEKPTVLVRRATPGQSVKSEPIELSAGEYEIYCGFTSGGAHKDRGMAGKLVVKK